MKKNTLFTAVAALALAGTFVASASAQGPGRDDRQGQYQGQNQGQYDGGRQSPQNDGARPTPQNQAGPGDGAYRDRRENWRESRAEARWDASRYNGYYENQRWFYGEPPADAYRRAGFSLGYRPWSVGQNLGYYNTRFQEVDYRRENLRPPARGSRWVRDDRGDYLLVMRDGRVMQVIVSGSQPRDRRQSWRDRNDARWDDARHNGYYRNNQWTYGQPAPGMTNVTLGYQPWQRGQRLGYYNGRYAEVDYRSNASLRAPPRGYHWVRNDSGDYLLAALAGGLIAEVILNSNR